MSAAVEGPRRVARQIGDLDNLTVRCRDDLADRRANTGDPEYEIRHGTGANIRQVGRRKSS
jgi:hypothetical protein